MNRKSAQLKKDSPIYTEQSNYNQYSKILLIDFNTKDYKHFVSGVNSSTFPIVYKNSNKHLYLENFIIPNLNHINSLAILSHGLSSNNSTTLPFLNNDPFFKAIDIKPGSNKFSDNVSFLLSLINKLNLSRIDFLACNNKECTEWGKYIRLLKSSKNGLEIGTSNSVLYDYVGRIPVGTRLANSLGISTYSAAMATFDSSNKSNKTQIKHKIDIPDSSGNILELTTNSFLDLKNRSNIGDTIEKKRKFTKLLIKSLYSDHVDAVLNKTIILKNVNLPGSITVENIVVINSSSSVSTNFTTTISKESIYGNHFYLLMENTDDKVIIPTMNSVVTITKTGNKTYSIFNGSETVVQTLDDSYTFDGMTIDLGSMIGYLVDSHAICFIKGTKIEYLNENSEIEYTEIENLRPGMLVNTYKHGLVPIAIVGTKKIYNPRNNYRVKDRLFICTPDKYPELKEKLIVTGYNCTLLDSMNEQQTINTLSVSQEILITDDKYRLMTFLDERAEPYLEEGEYSIYHITLDHPDDMMNYGIYANGLLVNSCSRASMEEL